jgi:hypothetical protein
MDFYAFLEEDDDVEDTSDNVPHEPPPAYVHQNKEPYTEPKKQTCRWGSIMNIYKTTKTKT